MSVFLGGNDGTVLNRKKIITIIRKLYQNIASYMDIKTETVKTIKINQRITPRVQLICYTFQQESRSEKIREKYSVNRQPRKQALLPEAIDQIVLA